jgi:hypothetical protein
VTFLHLCKKIQSNTPNIPSIRPTIASIRYFFRTNQNTNIAKENPRIEPRTAKPDVPDALKKIPPAVDVQTIKNTTIRISPKKDKKKSQTTPQ